LSTCETAEKLTNFDIATIFSKTVVFRRGTVLLQQPESQQVEAGGSAQFTCSALTDPALLPSLTIAWLRNEKPIGE